MNNTNKMVEDYDKAISLQGSWGYTPTTPFVDLQAKDTKEPQPDLHRMVEKTISYNLHSKGDKE
jgi:7-cyano-7-deazaguanine synthase in queuosine biosynthesis